MLHRTGLRHAFGLQMMDFRIVGPLAFNPCGNPQRLLSTGQSLQQSETAFSTSKQTENFIKGCPTPFIPRNLLHDHLLSEFSINQKSTFYGNLLQGLKCNDGSVVVFFICGEGTNRIASTVCHKGSSGKWSSIQPSLSSQSVGDSDQTDWSVSPSLRHSIQQLSAVWGDLSRNGGIGLAIVAARTDYHVYFCTVSIEEDQVQFISTAVAKLQVPTSHVTWSPHVSGTAAVLLESGTLCLFEIKASINSASSSVTELVPTATLRCPVHRSLDRLSDQSTAMRKNQDQEHVHNEPEPGTDLHGVAENATENGRELEKEWWCCEFGWLPHTMLIANSKEIFLVDLIEQNCYNSTFDSSRKTELNTNSSDRGIDLMADVGAFENSGFCSFESEKESFVAFGRDANDGMYEFSVATEQHVTLFDTRQPQTPILQWEHGMQQDPPSLIIMCPLSALRYINDKETSQDIQNGRVILAASFKSGDIRVFCYGSGVPTVDLPRGKNPKKQKVDSHVWGRATYAWDIPSRLYAPLSDVDDWRDVLSSSQGLSSQGFIEPKPHQGGKNIAGIVLLSDNSPAFRCDEKKKTFTVLQLTGQGELIAQTYQASQGLQDPTKGSISSKESKSDAEETIDAHQAKYHELKFEVLPTFLKYVHTGSILNPHSSTISQKGQPSIVGDDAACKVNPAQDQTIELMNPDSLVLTQNLQKTVKERGLETQLTMLVRELTVPLNMYEVGRKVLSMELPKRLSHMSPGLPSDLNAHWHRGYKFPSVSHLLGPSKAVNLAGHTFDDSRVEGEPSEDVLSNGLTGKASFQEVIPFPLLLEVQNIDKPSAVPSSENGSACQTDPLHCKRLSQGEDLTDTEHCNGSKDKKYDDVTYVDGQTLLLEGSQYVQGLIEQLVSRNEPIVISLEEPTQDWQENPDSDGQSSSQVLLYSMSEHGAFPGNSGRVNSKPEASVTVTDKGTDRMDIRKSTEEVGLHDPKGKSRTFVESLYGKFVAGKTNLQDQESHPAKQYLKIDPKLCPIKLCFTDPDEELEPGELTALEDMQASFLQWQQSFPPYGTRY